MRNIKAYYFDELSKDVQKKVIDNFRYDKAYFLGDILNDNIQEDIENYWSEEFYLDLKNYDYSTYPYFFSIKNGKITDIEEFLKKFIMHNLEEGFKKEIENFINDIYSIEIFKDEVYVYIDNIDASEELKKKLAEEIQDFLKKYIYNEIVKMIKEEENYIFSDEFISEFLIINKYEFLENGIMV